jgi:hypothetical protein
VTRRKPRAERRESDLSVIEMMTDDPEIDLATWRAHRAVWPQGNRDTAPCGFWQFEGPDDLRDPPDGFTIDAFDAFEALEGARRAWLRARGGAWRELLGEP